MPQYLNLVKILLPTAFAFGLGILITPIATHYFYKYKLWKKKHRGEFLEDKEFKLNHQAKIAQELSVPCVGGMIVWVSVLFSIFLFFFLSIIFPDQIFSKLNFLSRSQTFVPLAILILGALLGLAEDSLEIMGYSKITRNAFWYTKIKILIIAILGFIAGYWFYYKLGMDSISIPFDGPLELGMFFIPFVIIIMLATFSGGVIDGLDGLSGGVLASIFSAYTVIAFTNHQIDLAAFSGVIVGAILAFLWFNIPPARFYMGETGMMALTTTLATLAFLTDTVLLLPIIAFPLVITSGSNIIQMLSKKFRNGKKVFRIAPLHHHFEALGWPSYKVTMRYWVFSIIFAVLGIILAIIS
jgi:phospho-N-acetylmuramoyl-pentapeptide-transferase